MNAHDTDEPTKRRPHGLGRGLSALLGEVEREAPIAEPLPDRANIQLLPVARIVPHPDQPRRHFDEEALGELAHSIEARGLIQPIVVRPKGHEYQIVAGERRWRAAQKARLHDIPVIVRDFDDAETLEIALVENIQREDLNAIEEAEAYRRLIDDYGHSQEALGRLVHKSRSHVANLLRLLLLPQQVRDMVIEGALDMGHARAIIGTDDPIGLAKTIIASGLTVRGAEALARRSKRPAPPRNTTERDADISALERQLGDALGLRVRIAHRSKGGSVEVDYSSLDQLDLICQRLSGETI